MRLTPQRLAAGLAAVAAVALTGCVSLFPKSEPAQLYRFGPTGVTAGVAGPGTVPLGLLRAIVQQWIADQHSGPLGERSLPGAEQRGR